MDYQGKVIFTKVARFFSTQYTKMGAYIPKCLKLPKGHKMYQMAVIYSKWPKNIPIFSISRPSQIYPNWDFGFENKPSGNPDFHKWRGKRRFEHFVSKIAL
jgi:hypothetical protein